MRNLRDRQPCASRELLVESARGSIDASRIGVLSDTHGLIRPEVFDALSEVELFLHAGDIGSPEVLAALEAQAPVIAIRGNNDRAPWAAIFPELIRIELAGVETVLVHDLATFQPHTAAKLPRLVIAGHSHRARHETLDKVQYLNPGSAGPRRFKLPVTVAYLTIKDRQVSVDIINLG